MLVCREGRLKDDQECRHDNRRTENFRNYNNSRGVAHGPTEFWTILRNYTNPKIEYRHFFNRYGSELKGSLLWWLKNDPDAVDLEQEINMALRIIASESQGYFTATGTNLQLHMTFTDKVALQPDP